MTTAMDALGVMHVTEDGLPVCGWVDTIPISAHGPSQPVMCLKCQQITGLRAF